MVRESNGGSIGVAWERGIVEDLFCQAFNVPVPFPRGPHIPLEVFMLLTGLLMSDGCWCDFTLQYLADRVGSCRVTAGRRCECTASPQATSQPLEPLPHTSSGPWGRSLIGGRGTCRGGR